MAFWPEGDVGDDDGGDDEKNENEGKKITIYQLYSMSMPNCSIIQFELQSRG